MNSVERVVEYAGFTPEAPAVVATNRPPASWPDRGEIQVSRLVVRYAPHFDPVLKGLSFSVRPQEKVGPSPCSLAAC